jgi:hypothetical protein
MRSPKPLENSFRQQMDVEAVLRRERSLGEGRYGISLVAGCPFPDPLLEATQNLHLRLASIDFADLILPDPAVVHITVLRGRSARNQYSVSAAPPQALAAALENLTPVALAWSDIALDTDGAIRAYTIPSDWPFLSQTHARLAAEAVSHTFGVQTSIQRRLWATLGTLRATGCKPDVIENVQKLLSSVRLPETSISSLRLLYYRDLQLTSVDVLKEYQLCGDRPAPHP